MLLIPASLSFPWLTSVRQVSGLRIAHYDIR
jgi:hypothetical protein